MSDPKRNACDIVHILESKNLLTVDTDQVVNPGTNVKEWETIIEYEYLKTKGEVVRAANGKTASKRVAGEEIVRIFKSLFSPDSEIVKNCSLPQPEILQMPTQPPADAKQLEKEFMQKRQLAIRNFISGILFSLLILN